MWWEQQWLTRRIVLIRPSKALTFSVICYWTWKLFLNMIIWVLNKRWKMLSLCRRYERWQFRTPLLENTAYSPAIISLDLKNAPMTGSPDEGLQHEGPILSPRHKPVWVSFKSSFEFEALFILVLHRWSTFSQTRQAR